MYKIPYLECYGNFVTLFQEKMNLRTERCRQEPFALAQKRLRRSKTYFEGFFLLLIHSEIAFIREGKIY